MLLNRRWSCRCNLPQQSTCPLLVLEQTSASSLTNQNISKPRPRELSRGYWFSDHFYKLCWCTRYQICIKTSFNGGQAKHLSSKRASYPNKRVPWSVNEKEQQALPPSRNALYLVFCRHRLSMQVTSSVSYLWTLLEFKSRDLSEGRS